MLTSTWGDYALPPARSSFAIHTMIAEHYLHGAWYPVSGGTALVEAMARRIEEAGGSCRVNHEVTSICLLYTSRCV